MIRFLGEERGQDSRLKFEEDWGMKFPAIQGSSIPICWLENRRTAL